jgi:hypothetical protein
MRTFSKWALALVVPAVWVGTSWAAEEEAKMVPEGTTIQLILLRQKAVRQDIGLGRDHTGKIFEFTSKQYDRAREAMKLDQAERRQKFETMKEENERFLKDNLSREQRKRLDQITLQVVGLLWLGREEIARDLNLTEEQRQKAKDLREHTREEARKLLRTGSREGQREKFAQLRRETRNKLQELLTPDQRTKWRELVGRPFRGQLEFEQAEEGSRENR